jgi:tripartite-type tricarboxylate transporter receptor subunit TctC
MAIGSLALGVTSRSARAALVDKTVRWIVGFPPGGATDALARLLSPLVATKIGQTVIVDNRPGAGSSIAATALANAPPDGTMIMGADNGTLIINPVIYGDIKYDPDKDFRPIGLYAGINLLLATSAKSEMKTGEQFLEAARTAKYPIAYGSPGVGTPLHLAMELLARDANIRLTHIPYRGMAPALTDAVSGVIPSIVIDYTTAAEVIRAGLLRPLATLSGSRLAALPDVPTMAEQGVPNFSAGAWQGLIAPRKMPDTLVKGFSDGLAFAMADPTVKKRYEDLGLDMPPCDPQTFADRWQADRAVWQPLIRSLNIKISG